MPNRYELVSLLRTLAHEKAKCVLFSTHELDVALRMCDSIALVDNGKLHHLPVTDMVESGHIQRLFSSPDISSPAMALRRVDLPEPLRPIRAVSSPLPKDVFTLSSRVREIAKGFCHLDYGFAR